MNITNVECFPVWDGSRAFVFVVVDTDEGLSGVGEAGLTGRALAVAGVVEHFKPQLIGQDANRIEHLWQLLFRGGFFPAGNIGASALSAIDIALWDIQGKARGVPVYQLLGGLTRDRVVCYPHNQGRTPEALVASCQQSVSEGWKFCRWDLPYHDNVLEPGRCVRESIALFEAVRSAVGDDIELICDLHTRLDPAWAIRLCRESERFHPFFMEDPIRAENMDGVRHVRQHVSTPLALGEHFVGKWAFRQLIEEELTDYARMDVCICGGISEAKKIAGWCETHYIHLAMHNPLGPVCAAASLHLSLSSPLVGVQEQPRKPGSILTDVFPVQMAWADGYLLPPTRPGLGIEFDREAARAHPLPVQPGRGIHVRRLDGSFTNW